MIEEQNAMLLSGGSAGTPTTSLTVAQNSVRLRNLAGSYANRTVTVEPTSQRRGVISFWCKRGNTGSVNPQHLYQSSYNAAPYRNYSVCFNPDDSLYVNFTYQIAVGSGWSGSLQLNTNAKYRDTASWMHVYLRWDTTHPVASERGVLIVNGERVTSFATAVYPALNENLLIDSVGYTNYIGDTPGKGVFTQGTSFDGYLSEYNRVDGALPDVTEFGSFDQNGNWKVKPYYTPSSSDTVTILGDQYFSSVVLLMHLDGADGSASFVDSSASAKNCSPTGTAVTSTAQKKFGQSALLTNRSTPGAVSVPTNVDFAFPGDFTWEMFVYPLSWNADDILMAVNVTGGVQLGRKASGNLGIAKNGVAWVLEGSMLPPVNTWSHVAVTRSSSTLRIFVEGALIGSITDATNYPQGGLLVSHPSFSFNGYIDEVRVTKGVARYTTTFTPPNAAFLNFTSTSVSSSTSVTVPGDDYYSNVSLLLHMDGSNAATAFLDYAPTRKPVTVNGNVGNESGIFKFGTESASFDGMSSYLQLATHADFNMGTGDFTAECFCYFPAVPPDASGDALFTYGGDLTNRPFGLYRSGPNTFSFYFQNDVGVYQSSNITVASTIGRWIHVAGVKSGTTITIYVDGVAGTPMAVSGNANTATQGFFVGRFPWNTPSDCVGYIDELRVTKGVARYTGTFTPPNAAFRNYQSSTQSVYDPYYNNVVLLMHGDGFAGTSNFQDSSQYKRSGTPLGAVQHSSVRKMFGSTSIEFGGGNDRITYASSSDFDLGSIYTIEAFVFPRTVKSSGICMRGYYDNNSGTWTGLAFSVRLFNTGAMRFYFYALTFATEQIIDVPANSLEANKWTHFAMVREGTVGRVYINGVLSGSVSGLNTPAVSSQTLRLGVFEYTTNTEGFDGYLEEFRITKGVARYNSNFAIPSAAYPDNSVTTSYVDPYFSGVLLLLHMDTTGVNTFVDSSNYARVVSKVGAPVMDTNIKKFGVSSGYFDGSSYLEVPVSTDWQFGAYDFTIEAFVYPTANVAQEVMACRNGTAPFWLLRRNADGTIRWYATNSASVVSDLTTQSTLPLNQFSHLAVTRKGGFIRIFINGIEATLSGTNAVQDYENPTYPLYIGAGDPTSNYWNGYIDEVRITKGTARYTSNFVVPSSAFLSLSDRFGANGFHLDFSDRSSASALFYDQRVQGTLALNETFDQLSGWYTDQVDPSSSGGAVTVSGGIVYPTSFGTGSGWHGPKLVKSFAPLADFDFTFSGLNFGNVGGDIVYMAVSVGKYRFVINDAWDASYLAGEGYSVGDGVSSSAVPIATAQTLANADVRMIRIGTRFYCYLNGNLIWQTTTYATLVSSVAIEFAQYQTYPTVSMNVSAIIGYGSARTEWAVAGVSTTLNHTYDAVYDAPYGFESDLVGNYATLDPWSQSSSTAGIALQQGNLLATVPQTAGGSVGSVVSTLPLMDGQYFEVTCTAFSPTTYHAVWVGVTATPESPITHMAGVVLTYAGAGNTNGAVYRFGGTETSISPFAMALNDVIGFAYKSGALWISRNGVWLTGNPALGDNASYTFTGIAAERLFATVLGRDGNLQFGFNFGQQPFVYSVPSTFNRGHTVTWPTPTIVRPKDYVDVTNYTGDGSNGRSVKLFEFEPEISWHKSRTGNINHILFNRSRGDDKGLIPNLNLGESPYTNAHAFLSGGYEQLGYTTSGGPSFEVNKAGEVYNVLGIASGAAVGVDVIKYVGSNTATNRAHGLGVKPELVVYKRLDYGSASDWAVVTDITGTMLTGYLNKTDPFVATAQLAPLSSVLRLHAPFPEGNASGSSYMAMSFASIPGYLKVGTYAGRANANGPSVYCGFRPRFVLIKQMTGVAAHWYMFDSLRDKFNIVSSQLQANLSNAESIGGVIDFTSTGFVLRTVGTGSFNGAGDTYLFLAFAEVPSKYALAR